MIQSEDWQMVTYVTYREAADISQSMLFVKKESKVHTVRLAHKTICYCRFTWMYYIYIKIFTDE